MAAPKCWMACGVCAAWRKRVRFPGRDRALIERLKIDKERLRRENDSLKREMENIRRAAAASHGGKALDDLELSIRTWNCLRKAGILTARELFACSDEYLLSLPKFGRKSLAEIRALQSEETDAAS